MKDINKNIYLLLAVLASVALILLKKNTLGLPFYWDEAWVYGPAVKKMGEHLCFLPSCADDLTRGHPLLFHITGGLWIKLFGASFMSLHCFALAVTMVFQWSCFYIGSRLFNYFYGFVFSTLVIAQNIVFAQSSLVLPELFLGVFCIWTFYFFYKNKLAAYLIAGSLLCLVKEQGVVLIFALSAWKFFEEWKEAGTKEMFSLKVLKKSMIWVSPVILLILFVSLQKFQKGYFLFPEHLEMIKSNFRQIGYQFKVAVNDVTISGGRFIISAVLLVIFLFAGKTFPLATRLFLLIMLLIVIKTISGKWGFPVWLVIATAPLLSALIFYRIFVSEKTSSMMKIQGPCFFFVVFYLLFCSVNFFTDRYLVCALPFFILYVLTEFYFDLENKKTAQFILLPALLLFSVFSTYNFKGFADYAPRYYEAIKVQQEMIDYGAAGNLKDKRLLVSFVLLNNMTNPEAGFVKSAGVYTNVTNVFVQGDRLPDYIFDSNIDRDSSFVQLINKFSYKVEKQFRSGEAEGRIYVLSNK